jgi:hypothetical protein
MSIGVLVMMKGELTLVLWWRGDVDMRGADLDCSLDETGGSCGRTGCTDANRGSKSA